MYLNIQPKYNPNESNLDHGKPSNVGYFDNIDLDLEASNYPKKYQIFVGELKTLLENIKLSNELISSTDEKQSTLDEGVRLVVSNLRDLSSNLVL